MRDGRPLRPGHRRDRDRRLSRHRSRDLPDGRPVSRSSPAISPATARRSRRSASPPSPIATIRSCAARSKARCPAATRRTRVTSSIMRAATAWNVLDRAGVPGITDVWCPPVQAGINLLIQMKQSYRNQAKQAANAIWGSSAAHVRYKHITVVDDDIDIHDYAAVDWAIALSRQCGRGRHRHHAVDLRPGARSFGAQARPQSRAVRHRQMEPGADRRHHESRLRPRPGLRRRALPAEGVAGEGRHRQGAMRAGASSASASRKAGDERAASIRAPFR